MKDQKRALNSSDQINGACVYLYSTGKRNEREIEW